MLDWLTASRVRDVRLVIALFDYTISVPKATSDLENLETAQHARLNGMENIL